MEALRKYKVLIQTASIVEKEVEADDITFENDFVYFHKGSRVIFAVTSNNLYYFEEMQ